mgnify:CR=1 FL=1
MFGVLYTLSKERLNEGWRFVVFAMVLDYLQVGALLGASSCRPCLLHLCSCMP